MSTEGGLGQGLGGLGSTRKLRLRPQHSVLFLFFKLFIWLCRVLVVAYRRSNGNPLQYSCLENPRDGGARWAAFCGVAESDTTEAT